MEGILGLEQLIKSLADQLEGLFETHKYYRRSKLTAIYDQIGDCIKYLAKIVSFFEASKFSKETADLISAMPMIASITSGILLANEFKKEFDQLLERYKVRGLSNGEAGFDSRFLSERFPQRFQKHAQIWELHTLIFESSLSKYVVMIDVELLLIC
jgi:hypothetical protein